jgi:AmmeMemoRadiSam system protein A
MPRLDEQERQFLLRVARQSVEEAILGRLPPQVDPASPALLEPRGAFVTLKARGQLRGCIGHVVASQPLYRTVQDCARLAAVCDPRFKPVRADEVPNLRIEISVLSPLEPIRPDQVEVGRHGLMVTIGVRRGVLLPQVPIEWNWGRERFLEETCLKAGLAPDAWRHGATIEAFTAEAFSERPGPAVRVPFAGRQCSN